MKHLQNYDEYAPHDENYRGKVSWFDKAKDAVGKAVSDVIDKGVELKDKGMDKFDDVTGRIYSTDPKGLMYASVIARHIPEHEAFKKKVIAISAKLKINPNWLLAIIYKESHFVPHAKNPNSSASGLLQMVDRTAKSLGTTTSAIRKMGAVEQLDYIYKYFKPYTGKIKGVEDMYLITFSPAYFKYHDQPDKTIASGKTARINRVVDLNKDGVIKMGEFRAYVLKGLPSDINELPKKTA